MLKISVTSCNALIASIRMTHNIYHNAIILHILNSFPCPGSVPANANIAILCKHKSTISFPFSSSSTSTHYLFISILHILILTKKAIPRTWPLHWKTHESFDFLPGRPDPKQIYTPQRLSPPVPLLPCSSDAQ